MESKDERTPEGENHFGSIGTKTALAYRRSERRKTIKKSRSNRAMNRTIQKCEAYKQKTAGAALEKAREAYHEARGNFYDTGYDRYFNKMEKMEKEIEELEEYLNRDDIIRMQKFKLENERREIEEWKKTIKNKLSCLIHGIPECTEARNIRNWLYDH